MHRRRIWVPGSSIKCLTPDGEVRGSKPIQAIIHVVGFESHLWNPVGRAPCCVDQISPWEVTPNWIQKRPMEKRNAHPSILQSQLDSMFTSAIAKRWEITRKVIIFVSFSNRLSLSVFNRYVRSVNQVGVTLRHFCVQFSPQQSRRSAKMSVLLVYRLGLQMVLGALALAGEDYLVSECLCICVCVFMSVCLCLYF